MKISILQHAATEGPGEIAAWAVKNGHSTAVHHLYRGEVFPSLEEFDLLVILGGEMNIYQYRDWPWLKHEREFINVALRSGKRAVGICLGAQLLADVLGARVVQNPEIEIGWHPITWTREAIAAFPILSTSSTVLHWHGDTFSLPPGSVRLAASEGCPEQGFLMDQVCLGLQFHMEVDPDLVWQFVDGQGDWPTGRYTQRPDAIIDAAPVHSGTNAALLHAMLDRFCAAEVTATPVEKCPGIQAEAPRRVYQNR